MRPLALVSGLACFAPLRGNDDPDDVGLDDPPSSLLEHGAVVPPVTDAVETQHGLTTASPSMMQERERRRAGVLDDQRESPGQVIACGFR